MKNPHYNAILFNQETLNLHRNGEYHFLIKYKNIKLNVDLIHNQVIFLSCVLGNYFRCKFFLPRCAMTEPN